MRLCIALLPVLAAGLSCARRGPAAAPTAYRGPVPQPVFERQIRNAVDAGDGDYEVRRLREKMAAEPDNLKVRLELARAYQDRGFPEVALEHCRLAAERFPASPEVALETAKLLRAASQHLEAARTLDVFLVKNPGAKSPELFSWQGILRDEMGQWTEGEKAHRQAMEMAPGSDWLHNNLGYNLLMQQRRAEAAGEFRKALDLNPASALARNNLALALASTSEQALSEWKRLYDPATAHNNLAAVMIEQGRYGEARHELDIALGLNRYHSAALNNLRLVSELDGRPALLRAGAPETRRTGWKSVLRGLFVGPLSESSKPAAPAASSNKGSNL